MRHNDSVVALAFPEIEGPRAAIVAVHKHVGEQPKPVFSAEPKQLPLVLLGCHQPKGFEGEV
jgi:hypothetical protein